RTASSINCSVTATNLLTALFLFSAELLAQAAPPQRVEDRLLLKTQAGVSERAVRDLFATHGLRQERMVKQIGVRVVHLPPGKMDAVLNALSHDRRVQFVEPDYLLEADIVPNDPYYSSEWHLPKVQAPQGWDISTGSTNIIVAILDTGV